MEHELWDLLDKQGNPTGQTIVRGDPLGPDQYHLVEHIWVVDSKGRILIQRRADHRQLMAGMWAATGGCVKAGEESERAARRELFEELSIHTVPGELVYGGRMRRRNSFTDVWVLYRDLDPSSLRLQKEEVDAVRWVEPEELVAMLKNRSFHHYGNAYFQFVFRAIERGRRTLYVTDLDGTLLQEDGQLSDTTVEAFNHLISRGMLLSVGTSRGILGIAVADLDRIRFRIPVILLGGAILYDTYHRRIVRCCEMDAATVGAVLRVYKSLGRTPQLYRRRGNEIHIFYTEVNEAEDALLHRKLPDGTTGERYCHKVPQLRESPAVFFSSQGSYEEQKKLRDALAAVPGIRISFYQDAQIEDDWFLEIAREDADKGQGAERLRQYVRAQRIVAFGDNRNDLPLFQAADLACCVENATPEARAAADRVIGSAREDGVAEFLQSIYHRKV